MAADETHCGVFALKFNVLNHGSWLCVCNVDTGGLVSQFKLSPHAVSVCIVQVMF